MAGPIKPDVQKELRNLRQRFSALENMLAGQDPAGGRQRPEIDLNAVVSDLTYSLITSNASLAGIADIVLNYAKVFTDSEHGYVSSIDPETGDNLCHTLTGMMGDACQITPYEKGIVFPKRPDGQYPALWGHCLNTQTAFFTNAPAAHPAAGGMPDRHIPIFNFLSVPAIIETNLEDIIAPFISKVISQNVYLTPQEIQVANLVRAGHQSKEISELLEISVNAVSFHRKNIRAKLGLKHEGINLRSYLLTLPDL